MNSVIDLSHHNGPIDFAVAKQAGILGVIHKCTQGSIYLDSKYTPRKAAAEAVGLLWGAYHFGDGSPGEIQAQQFVGSAGDAKLLVLDFEENTLGSSMDLTQAHIFVNTVYSATGRWPGLYGGFYLRQLLAGKPDPILQNCWLWLADYRANPELPPGWDKWTLWQYTDKGEVPGIGTCDRDQFDGDAMALQSFWSGESV